MSEMERSGISRHCELTWREAKPVSEPRINVARGEARKRAAHSHDEQCVPRIHTASREAHNYKRKDQTLNCAEEPVYNRIASVQYK